MQSGIGQPATLAIRPLTGGMSTKEPSLQMSIGQFRDVCGYDVRAQGLRRVDGRRVFVPEAIPFWNPGEVVSDVVNFWGTDDKQFNVAISNRGLYKIEYATPGAYYEPVFFVRDYTVNSYNGTTGVLTFATNSPEDDGVRAGDYIVLASAPTVRYAISAVSDMTVTIATGLTIAGSAAFNVLREFAVAEPFYVDYACYARTTENWMILVDGSVDGIYAYNGGFLKPFPLHFNVDGNPLNDTVAYNYARTVMYFSGRLYFGSVTLSGATYRQRIVWSTVLDLQELEPDAYQDLDETPGQIIKLTGLGALAMAYFSDAVYYGRETNLDGLPYAFTKLDSGGVGLAGQRASTPFFDGQVFVSTDEIYYVTASDGLTPIGTAVLDESVRATLASGGLGQTLVRVDVPRQRIMIGFARAGGSALDTIFVYNYSTKAWSRIKTFPITTFGVTNFADEVEYDDVDADATYDDYASVLYAALGTSFAERQLTFVDPLGWIRVLNDNRTTDELPDGTEAAIECVLETPDYDLDQPDTNKTVLELRLKVAQAEVSRSTPLEFAVTGSVDLGETWKWLGRLTIPISKSEGSVGFRLTGSHFRFRIASLSVIEPYTVTEFTIRAVQRNSEGNRAGTTSHP